MMREYARETLIRIKKKAAAYCKIVPGTKSSIIAGSRRRAAVFRKYRAVKEQ